MLSLSGHPCCFRLCYSYSRCNTLAGEHLTAAFRAINPQHCVPTLVDGDVVIWDSHAICTYLAAKYAPAGTTLSLNPNNVDVSDVSLLVHRARLDQRLHYHHGTLFARYYAVIAPLFGKPAACEYGNDDQMGVIHEAIAFLEDFLQADEYLVGAKPSVADVLCVTTVSSIVNVLKLDLTAYVGVQNWLLKLADVLPGYEQIETIGVQKMYATLLQRLESNRLLKNVSKPE